MKEKETEQNRKEILKKMWKLKKKIEKQIAKEKRGKRKKIKERWNLFLAQMNASESLGPGYSPHGPEGLGVMSTL